MDIPQTEYDVFISYSRKDYRDEQGNVIPGNEVSKIKDALANEGLTYWFDEEGIYSGEQFTDKILSNIEASRIFLFLSTKNACDSPWTSKEIACADELGKLIIPVRIDNTRYHKKVLFRIADLSYVDYGRNPEKGMAELIKAIKNGLDQLKKDAKLRVVSFDKTNMKGMDFFDDLQDYITNKQTICIKYNTYKARDPEVVVIFPYLLKESRHRWYLIGSKPNDKKVIILALDRIVSVETNEEIPYCDNESVDFNHYFDDVIGVSRYIHEKPRDVVFWVSNFRRKHIETKPLHSSQKEIKETMDGGCVFGIHVVVNYELYSELMSYGSDIIVLSPQKVVNHIRKEFSKAMSMYDDEAIKNKLL